MKLQYYRITLCSLIVATNHFNFVIPEILPLVEFQLEQSISDEEAIRLIESSTGDKKANDGGWKEEAQDGDVQVLRMDEAPQDPFTASIMNFDVIMTLSDNSVLI